MDIENKIVSLEEEIAQLRTRWKDGSPAMRKVVEQEARQKRAQINVFKSVLRRRLGLPKISDTNQQKLI